MSDIVQRSEEWHQERLGKITASRISDIMPLKSGKYSTSRENLAYELVAELLTGTRKPIYTNQSMQWGIDQESVSRLRYEAITGSKVIETGFYNHSSLKLSGASPDGLVGSNGLVEFKNPETSTFLRLVKTGEVNQDHLFQMQWQMDCVGEHILYNDYFVHDSRIADTQINYFYRRIERDNDLIETIRREVYDFTKLMDDIMDKVRLNAG